MSSIRTTQIDGDVSVGRNVAAGGDADIMGNMNVGHNLNVKGWLYVRNMKTADKGIFESEADLISNYPSPRSGWYAAVGTGKPYALYVSKSGLWVNTGDEVEPFVSGSDIEDIHSARDEAIAEIEQAKEGIKLDYQIIEGKEVQLTDGQGNQLMPKTTEGNVFRLISSYVAGGSKTGTTSAYCTINIATLAQNTTYKITVESNEPVGANCAVHKLVNTTSKGTIATLLNGTSYVETTFDTGENSINKIQIRGYQARTFVVRIYSYIEEDLPTHLVAIEGEISAVYNDLHNNLSKGFKAYSGLKSGSGASGTIYPLNPLPHWVVPSLYCKLVVSNIVSTGSVTINALAESKKVGEIGKLGSADSYKEFEFQFSSEFNKIQFVCGSNVTLDYNVQLFVISDIYRDAQKHLDYNTKSALYKSSLKCIAHQGFSIDQYSAQCRRSAIIAAAKNHFDGIEVDLAFSSDDVPFLCHDASFVSGGQTIVIANETADALVTYNYYGETICTLEEAIKLCKLYGLDIILDHTADISNQDRATAVVEILNRYRAWSNVIWTTSSPVLNRSAILALYPQARFHVVSDNAISEAKISNVNSLAEQGYNVILSFNWENNTVSHLQDDVLPNLDARVKLSCYTLDNTSNPMSYNDNLYKQYMPYVDYILSNVNNKFRVETGYLNIYDNTAELE